MYTVKRIESKSDWSEFIALPWDIYEGDKNWIPPLRIAVRDLLDPKKNPFFSHAEMLPLIALRDGECVGRVVGVVDQNHNQFHKEKTGFFGFFECINDPKVAHALLDEVATWVKSKGMTTLRGPMNPSTNHECGLLVEGFDDAPTVMMTYNPPYYQSLLEGWGLAKTKDLYSYNLNQQTARLSDRLMARSERLKKANHITFRSVNLKDFDAEVERILDVYNNAWEENWGFVPFTPEEFRHMAKDMKAIMDPRLCLIAEVRGKIAGFALCLPDVNQVLKKVKDGKLFPWGIFKLLWNLKGPGKAKTVNRCRIITLGIRKEYRDLSLGPLFYSEYIKVGPELGYSQGEAGWILEDNGPMNKAMKYMGGEQSKVYRIYDRPLMSV